MAFHDLSSEPDGLVEVDMDGSVIRERNVCDTKSLHRANGAVAVRLQSTSRTPIRLVCDRYG